MTKIQVELKIGTFFDLMQMKFEFYLDLVRFLIFLYYFQYRIGN